MKELQQHVETELNLLLEEERKANLNKPIEELEREAEMFGGLTPQEYINEHIRTVMSSVYDLPDMSRASLDYLFRTAFLLASYINLSPLTLDDSEFELVATSEEDGKIYQNKRNFSVFKSDKKGVYHLDGKGALDAALGKFEESEEKPKEGSKYEQLQLDLDC